MRLSSLFDQGVDTLWKSNAVYMADSIKQWLMIAPLLVSSMTVAADGDADDTGDVTGNTDNSDVSINTANVEPEIASLVDPFSFDSDELHSIQFTRSKDTRQSLVLPGNTREALGLKDNSTDYATYGVMSRQTEFSFKLKPKRPDFSREGAYGLDLFDAPRLNIQSYLTGPSEFGPYESYLHNGFEYSAGVRIEYEQADTDDTAYMSSSSLGLSYGRLGRLWYGAIDLNLEQFSADRFGRELSDVVSLDVTTGRKFGITGLDANSPLWMLSLRGNFDVNDSGFNDNPEDTGSWYINPSLFWQQASFMFSAQMQLPVQFETLDEEGEPDYRLRAVFEKQFK